MPKELSSGIPEGSLVCFLDEHDIQNGMVVGGYYMPKKYLLDLDQFMISSKRMFGLRAEDTIKWNLKDKDCENLRVKRLLDRSNDLRNQIFSIIDKIPIRIIMSLAWKGKPENREESWKWAFINIMQRISIILDRKRKLEKTEDIYPYLDVVFDWFPGGKQIEFYFEVYHNAYSKGYTFPKNSLPPLKNFSACPCLLVTAAKYSQALQLADFFVGATSEFFDWCYSGKKEQNVRHFFSSFFSSIHRGDNDRVLGCGLILKKDAAEKVRNKLGELGLKAT